METLVVDPQAVPADSPPTTPARTECRAATSRSNGHRSRGPATTNGKERSRGNALSHGLFARVIPPGKLALFGDRAELAELVENMQAEFGVRTTMGRALVESAALDLLRIRQLRAMEIALFEGGSSNDPELQGALQARDSAGQHRTDHDNELLHEAYGTALEQLREGAKLDLPEDVKAVMTADLWAAMTYDRAWLTREQETLKGLDESIATAAPAELEDLKRLRASTLESITENRLRMKETDHETYLIKTQAELSAFVTGRHRVPNGLRARWIELLEQQRSRLERGRAEVQNADIRIHQCRSQALLAAANKLEKLKLLSEYEDRVRRSMAKTIAMIKEVESGAVIDV